jgi:hypothetical protein
MSINPMLRLSIPKANTSCSKSCLLKNAKADHSTCKGLVISGLSKSTFLTKEALELAKKEKQYDKNLKSIVKYKPVNNENVRGSINLKPPPKKSIVRERSRSVRTKVTCAKSTPGDSSNNIEVVESCTEAFDNYKLQDKEVNIKSLLTPDIPMIKDNHVNNNEKCDLTIGDCIQNSNADYKTSSLINPLIAERPYFTLHTHKDKAVIINNDLKEINFPLSRSLNFETNRFNYLTIFQENINKINLGLFTFNYENIKINKENSTKFTTLEYRRLLTTLLEYDYGKYILKNLIIDEEIVEAPLERHKITERMRAKMIDWMIEVLGNYNCDENTFFLAVNIMDRYFHNCQETLKTDDLHLIGICSMFIASKFYDIFPIKLKMMTDKVSHGKYKPEDVKQIEEKIIKTLNYCVHTSTIHDFINQYVEQIFFFIENSFLIQDDQLSEYILCIYKNSEIRLDGVYYEKTKLTRNYSIKMLKLLNKVLIYITKMICYDYSLIGLRPSLVSASCLLVSLKICEEINSEIYINSYFMNKLSEISGHCEFDIVTHSQKILYNAQNYDLIFHGLVNLKKRHFNFTIEDIGM